MKRFFFLVLGLGMTIAICAQSSVDTSFRNTQLPLEQRVDILLRQMTLDEKLGFMEHHNPAIERLNIPAYSWWNEALHGVARNGFATVYPEPIALAATFDVPAIQETFSLIGDEARLKYNRAQKNQQYDDNQGITFFAPNINIFRDPRWGRGMETYGEDPYLTAQMGKACINGLQGNNPRYYKTLGCAKHFAVHSGPESIRHSFDVSVTSRDLWTTYLPAFETLVKETDLQQIMCGYNRFDGEPCCTNNKLLVQILKNQWQYKGLFVTDCWALNDAYERDTVIRRHETYPDAATTAKAAFGSVIDLECGSGLGGLKDAVNQGFISEEVINEHVRKVLTARFKLGMFDPAWMNPYNALPDTTKFAKQADKIAHESIVLLQNKSSILPIDPAKYKRIAILGPNAADSVMLCGNYNGTPRRIVTILDGIRQYISTLPKEQQPELYFDTTCHHVDGKYAIPRNFDKKIAKCDLVIFVGGLSPLLEGEQLDVKVDGFYDGDRTNIELPRIQEGMLRKLKIMNKQVVFVLCTGSAVALDWENDNMDAILCAWYGGQSAGTAVADVLFGKYNPAGKLPVTFYSSTNSMPPFDNYDMSGRTYRFMRESPVYRFGYGLSYTTFEYSKAKFDPLTGTLMCVVANTGNCDGEEVVQVYLHNNQDAAGPIKTLVGFQRVYIPKGQAVQLSFTIDSKFFNVFNDKTGEFEWRPGTFTLYYGNKTITITK